MTENNYYSSYLLQKTPLDKCLYLYDLYHNNLEVFLKLAKAHLTEFLPIIYTPTIGDAVINYSKNYRHPIGLIIAYEDRGNIKKILEREKEKFIAKKMSVAVVTDGEGVLGIGDQGVGGIYISLGKLMIYALCGGLDISTVLPVQLDVGTNNESLLAAPEYKGWRNRRISGEAYYEFVDEFAKAFHEVFPDSFLHWEDFGRDNARRVLDCYREFHPSFNDDIQGTGVVALAAVLSGVKKSGIPLGQHRVCIFGAGTAGCGIANLLCKGLSIEKGISFEEEAKNFYLIDRKGLLIDDDESLLYFQKPFARSKKEVSKWSVLDSDKISLIEVVRNARPTVLIGCSAVSGAFDEDVIAAMYAYDKKPIIMPISNPTSKSEATPEKILGCTEGNGLIATGSPFRPVDFGGKEIKISQCNNALAFPGIGIGMLKSGARILSDEMLIRASEVLALETEAESNANALLPDFSRVLEISRKICESIVSYRVKV